MNVQCPACGTVYIVPPENIGKNVECPCGAKFEAVAMPPDPPEDRPSEIITAPRITPREFAGQQYHQQRVYVERAPRYTAPITRMMLGACGLLFSVIAIFYFWYPVNAILSSFFKTHGGSTEAAPVLAALIAIPCGAIFGAFWYGMAAIIRLLIQISDQLAERN